MSTSSKQISDIYAEYQKANLPEAEKHCLAILGDDPANAEVHHLLGLVLIKKGDAANALKHFSRASEITPELAEAHFYVGVLHQGTGELDAARSAYRNALKARPGYPEASCNLGAVYHALGQTDNAAASYRDALSCDPGNFQIEYNLACTYQANNQLESAEKHLLSILNSKPGFLEAHFNLGLVLNGQGRTTDALKHFKQVLSLKPDHTDALNNIGNMYMNQYRYDSAITFFEQALSLEPENPKIHFNRGVCLKEGGQFARAADSFMEALTLAPDFPKAYAELYRCNQILCNWQSDTCTTDRLIELTKSCLKAGDESPVYPFDSLSIPFTPETLEKIAASHAITISRNAGVVDQHVNDFAREKGARLRIGYVSQKFNNHAGAHLIASLFGLHDRNKFQVFAYSIGENDNSSYRQRIEQGCENFIDMSEQGFLQVAQRIHDDGIDILVDLGVYNTHALTEIFALHPAPLQVSYLGYPGTSGADFYDYILTDRIVTPPEEQKWYTECFACLPHCYQVNDHELTISGEPPNKAEYTLPDNAFIFCSFNNSYKIEPEIFSVWMRILKRTPGSVLWLLEHSQETSRNLRSEAEDRGVDGKRLIFALKETKERHLLRHRHADLFLDTYYYNAHTTASDALRVGVPVITTPGNTFASRVAASLLSSTGLAELITDSFGDYEELAVMIASKPALLEKIRGKLTANLADAPLYDTPRFARHLEKAYEMMWQCAESGEKQPIEVPL